jgi:hypothetical protein
MDFDEIRPYDDAELPEIFEELIADPDFRRVMTIAIPGVPFEMIAHKMRSCKSKTDFQKAFCYDFLHKIINKDTDGTTIDCSTLPDRKLAYTYVSNHRDIILDSGLLSVKLVDEGLDTVEIAIGDNLLIYPWIKKLVRVNKSFIVQRALSMRQMLESSIRLSNYMHYAIREKRQSVWIAQREGRAKDSDDRTQESVLKMLAMGGEGDIIDRLLSLNIAPLTISYQYDPCDYLKAKEFQLKRDNACYKKCPSDDLLNMKTGLTGYKGLVHFQVATCINDELRSLDRSLPKQELFTLVADLIDHHIHANYRLYPNNYIAHDMLSGQSAFVANYSEEEKIDFLAYLDKQIDRIDLVDKDASFLRGKMLLMYANPLTNYLHSVEASAGK